MYRSRAVGCGPLAERSRTSARHSRVGRHPSLDIGPLRAGRIAETIAILIAKLHAEKERHRTDMLASRRNDGTLDIITDLHEGRVGAPFDGATLADLFKDRAERYDKSVPSPQGRRRG